MRASLLTGLFCTSLATTAFADQNVLFVLADDMGVDASPCHSEGSSMVRMPTLKALCADGMVFDNAHAAPVCSPTRAMIMTGEYSSNNGLGAVAGRGSGLSTNKTSLFDVLGKDASVSANLIGKWHLGSSRDLTHPEKLGVADFYGTQSGGVSDYYNWKGNDDGRAFTSKEYVTTAFSDKAIDWIDDQSGDWVLWLSYTAPHDPFHEPPSDLHSFGNLPTVKENRGRGQDVSKHYFAALEALDTELGRLLGSLSRQERAQTTVIFLGDNGTPSQIGRNLNTVKMSKGSLMDGGTRVPLVISGPGVRTGRTDALAMATDIFATVLDLSGTNARPPSDSYSLTPILSGPASSGREAILIELFGQETRRGRNPNGWKIQNTQYALIQPEDGTAQLYDMTKDPMQNTNLINKGARYTAIASELSDLRDAYLRQ